MKKDFSGLQLEAVLAGERHEPDCADAVASQVEKIIRQPGAVDVQQVGD
jgi:hypothetical protein